MDYNDIQAVLSAVTQVQDNESDQREQAREAEWFCNKHDGQWEPEIIKSFSGRPRYTFDITTPEVKRLANEIKQANFAAKVSPDGNGADEDIAKIFHENIKNMASL